MCCIKGGRLQVQKHCKEDINFPEWMPSQFLCEINCLWKIFEIVSKNEEHNHPCSENMFNALPHERLNLPKELKEKVSVVYALLWADYTGTNIWFYSLFQLKSEMSTTHLSGLNLQQFNKRCFKKNRMK